MAPRLLITVMVDTYRSDWMLDAGFSGGFQAVFTRDGWLNIVVTESGTVIVGGLDSLLLRIDSTAP